MSEGKRRKIELFLGEMKNRRKFYKERPHYMKPNDSESVGEVSDEEKFSINDEYITLSLTYHTKQGIPEEGFQEIASLDKVLLLYIMVIDDIFESELIFLLNFAE